MDGFPAQKPKELLSYLLLHRERPFLREVLTTLLWGESDPDRARKYFRQTLWQIQHDLHSLLGEPGEHLLLVEGDWIRLNPELQVWCDVDALQLAFDKTRGVSGSTLGASQVQSLVDAVQLYQGDLLEGWYQDWCLFERERLQNIYLLILDKLVEYCETNSFFEDGIVYSMRILKIDYAREKTHRGLMRIYNQIGDRTNALRQYERCVAILKAEMGVSPSQRTQKLFEAIQKDRLVPTGGMIHPPNHPADSASIKRLVYHLTQLRRHLSQAHEQVEQDIEIVQNILLEDK